MTVAIPMNMDALGREFVVVVVNHNHNKVKVYFYSRALQAPFFILRSKGPAVNSACFAGPLGKSREKNCCSTGMHHIDCKVY
jgi:hypothetical protein